eukprot:CAMPEP_0175122420 /NCGR_PEP_ID=MMETSP0087-20121206/1706_1 /TAXON_ID=136419 /ORGANISM="Unknown Unknown, Strain D1" /LENGTH=56 /DNA_ID=CAMNT_0016404055 /DNA_START=173 /DNA_END=343 /DNA_ORIENTATION=+
MCPLSSHLLTILGDVKCDYVGQLSGKESKTLEELVIKAREQLAIYLSMVEKFEGKK